MSPANDLGWSVGRQLIPDLGKGGPGTDTAILPYLMYEAGFKTYDFGYASAIASFLVIAATGLSLVLVRLTGFGAMRSTREGM